jgi:hypothetical protein
MVQICEKNLRKNLLSFSGFGADLATLNEKFYLLTQIYVHVPLGIDILCVIKA